MLTLKTAARKSLLSLVPLMLLMLTLSGCQSSVVIPDSYSSYNDPEGEFSMDYPTGWDAAGGGKHGIKWAEFSSGSAMIRLDFDTSSSLIGDIASGGQGATMVDGKSDPTLAPVHKAHEFNKAATADLYSNYKEGEPIPYRSGLGDSRKSEFTSSSLTGSIQGYRATSLTLNNGVVIRCTCSPTDWVKLRHIYDKVLESVSYGK